MKKTKKLLLISILISQPVLAQKPFDVTIGVERYHENYREYDNGQRFMQQAGYLNGLNAAFQYHFNDRHSAKLEGRYAKGKIEYTGGESASEEHPNGTSYGSIKQGNLPRHAYDIHAVYAHQHPISPRVALIGEAGMGYRVLRDLSSRLDPEDYDRKNKTAYAKFGAGLKINLPYHFEFSPKISYHHGVYGRQYSYFGDDTIELKQRHARGVEIELPISKTLRHTHKFSFVPFYRGWRVPDSVTLMRLETDEDGNAGIASYTEPENYTHEVGMKLQYTF